MKTKLLKKARRKADSMFAIHQRNGENHYFIASHALCGLKWSEVPKFAYHEIRRIFIINEAEKIFGNRKWSKPRR